MDEHGDRVKVYFSQADGRKREDKHGIYGMVRCTAGNSILAPGPTKIHLCASTPCPLYKQPWLYRPTEFPPKHVTLLPEPSPNSSSSSSSSTSSSDEAQDPPDSSVLRPAPLASPPGCVPPSAYSFARVRSPPVFSSRSSWSFFFFASSFTGVVSSSVAFLPSAPTSRWSSASVDGAAWYRG